LRYTPRLFLGILATAAAPAMGFDFESLQQLLHTQNIGTVEQLIAALPATQRGNYALVFESRSLQGASFENPRAILFGPDARFIVTFDGSPAQRGFRTVETMEFDAASSEFRLRELLFPEQAGGSARVEVSEVNPARCARCHGTPARPVWDTFPLWPGAYGERYRASLSAREHTGIKTFLAQQATHPRYRQLLYAQRFADTQTFRPSAVSQYSGAVREPPNAELTLALTRLQSQSITRQLQQQPAFEAYRYALLGLADESCGSLAEFYPEGLWRAQRAAFARFATDTLAANSRQAQLKSARAASAGGSGASAATATTALIQLRFVAESALSVPTRDWTLALERGTYDFTMPPLTGQPLRETLLAPISVNDAALQELSDSSTASDGNRYCSYLQRRSRTALAAADVGTAAALEANVASPAPAGQSAAGSASQSGPPAPAALQLCVACHESGVAPPVPFSNPTELTQQLRTRSRPHGTLQDEIRFRLSAAAGAQRMPLGLNLSDGDRRSLESYFATLASSAN
jgi:hypothetical protein